MASPSSRIVDLANIISSNTSKVDDYLKSKGHPQPGFNIDSPIKVLSDNVPDIEAARTKAVEAAMELQDLLQGVEGSLMPAFNMTALQAIYRFEIAQKFPVGEEISFEDLADKCGLQVHDLRRIVRYAIVYHHVFCEPRKGIVAHSAASKALAEDKRMQNAVGLGLEEMWPAYVKTVDAFEKFPKSDEPNASGFSLANDTTETVFGFLGHHSARAERFAGAMAAFGSEAGMVFLSEGFPWDEIRNGGTVVDVGGSQGHVSAFLAGKHPHLRFIVQDLPEVVSESQLTYQIPDTVRDRVSLMASDFFEPQKVSDADVFLIRHIFHNWSDSYCLKILRNLIPGLKPGAKIVINDQLLPEPNALPLTQERFIRGIDMVMLSMQNSRERECDDWIGLLQQADRRFRFESVKTMEKSATVIIVAAWDN